MNPEHIIYNSLTTEVFRSKYRMKNHDRKLSKNAARRLAHWIATYGDAIRLVEGSTQDSEDIIGPEEIVAWAGKIHDLCEKLIPLIKPLNEQENIADDKKMKLISIYYPKLLANFRFSDIDATNRKKIAEETSNLFRSLLHLQTACDRILTTKANDIEPLKNPRKKAIDFFRMVAEYAEKYIKSPSGEWNLDSLTDFFEQILLKAHVISETGPLRETIYQLISEATGAGQGA